MSQCPSGKWRYKDEIAAKMALTTVRRQDKSWRPKLEQRVYRCHLCRGWHTTSQPARPKRKPS